MEVIMTDFELTVIKLRLLEAWIETDELIESQSRKTSHISIALAGIKAKLDEALAAVDKHAPKLTSS
ncbi:hypothetical protein CFB48_24070 [Burkholderia sp. AU33647]|nr:hypothetical protein CFB48_24070 [Burkholderia sp. AU33647]